jgi:hypothetical protein
LIIPGQDHDRWHHGRWDPGTANNRRSVEEVSHVSADIKPRDAILVRHQPIFSTDHVPTITAGLLNRSSGQWSDHDYDSADGERFDMIAAALGNGDDAQAACP